MIWLLPALGLLSLAFLPPDRRTPEVLTKRERWLAWLAGGVALSVSAWRAVTQPVFSTEYYAVDRALVGDPFAHHTTQDFASLLHASYGDIVLREWLGAVELLDAPGGLLLLRLPSVLAAPVFVWVLMRLMGRLGAAPVGAGAALLVTFGTFGGFMVMFSNYGLETLFTAVFLERLVALVQGHSVHRSLAAAAVAAFGSGYATALVLAPGALLVAAFLLRTRSCRALVGTAVSALLLAAPLLASAITAVRGLATLTVTEPSAVSQDVMETLGHAAIVREAYVFGKVISNVSLLLSGLPGAVMLPLALLAAWRWRAGVLFVIATLLVGELAGLRMELNLQNLGPVLVPLALTVVGGLHVAFGLVSPRLVTSAVLVASVLLAPLSLRWWASGYGGHFGEVPDEFAALYGERSDGPLLAIALAASGRSELFVGCASRRGIVERFTCARWELDEPRLCQARTPARLVVAPLPTCLSGAVEDELLSALRGSPTLFAAFATHPSDVIVGPERRPEIAQVVARVETSCTVRQRVNDEVIYRCPAGVFGEVPR